MPDRVQSPLLLALNTCGATGSVALGRASAGANELEILSQAEFAGRTYSAQLIPRIGELLAGQNATIRDVAAIVVVRGPGSFTGIRVGLSAAKGLAEAMGSPVIAISRLALLAHISRLPHVLAVIDAGRGEYYVGEYRQGLRLREVLLGGAEICEAVGRPGAGVLVREASDGLVGAGNSYGGALSAFCECEPVRVPAPDAADALRFGLDRIHSRSFEDVETLDANYLRRSDAELFGAAGTGVSKEKDMGATSNRR